MPENTVTAFNSDGQFGYMFHALEVKPEEFADNIRKAVKECCLPDEFGVRSSSDHSLSVTAGIGRLLKCRQDSCTQKALHSMKLRQRVQAVFVVLILKNMQSRRVISRISGLFSELLDKNLFTYHFSLSLVLQQAR